MRYGLVASVMNSRSKGVKYEFRFWRIYAISNHHASSQYITLNELELYANENQTDLTIGTAGAISQSELSATYFDDFAFDGDNNTRWASNNTTPSWIGWDFGEGNEVQITGLALTPGAIPTETPKEFYLQYSEDGITWFDYAFFETAAPVQNVQQIISFPPTSDVQILDLSTNAVFGGPGDGAYVVINDISTNFVYGGPTYPGIVINDISTNVIYGGA